VAVEDGEGTHWVRSRRPVGPNRWRLEPREADQDGVVGAGADLESSTLVAAYARGVFPWPHEGMPLLWFSPDPRAVLVRERFHLSRSLRRTLRRRGWTTTVDRATEAVIRACSDRPEGTWITPEMRDAYLELSGLGWVHSVEVWEGDELVGGLYGVQIGGVFTAESKFHRRSDASKVALLELLDRLTEAGGALVDVQIMTEHLRSLGAHEVPREEFLALLARVGGDPCRLRAERRPVSRLAAA
jgi:leucyl/phenylalanyl-tRNA--protein transferase